LTKNGDTIRSMAKLMSSGAALTDLSCPACASPLFRLKNGDLWCAKCQKKVIVVKENEQVRNVEGLTALAALESTLTAKVTEFTEKMRIENDVEKIQKLNSVIGALLENLERIKRIGRYKS